MSMPMPSGQVRSGQGPDSGLPTVYGVTPDLERATYRPQLAEEIAGLLCEGHLVQVRQKRWSPRSLVALVEEVQRLAPPGALQRLLVNDRCEVALCFPGVGLQLPEAGLEIAVARRILGQGRLLGVSCHDSARLIEAARSGADLATLGPVFATPGKGPALGVEALRLIECPTGLPVYALGGIDAGNAARLASTFVYGLACIRGIFCAASVTGAAAELRTRFMEARRGVGC
jgi:thiamine-phosphate pyrophosphorylase